MRLLALSDLHVGAHANREFVASLDRRPDDWLLVAGDVAETTEDIKWALGTLSEKFAQVVWTPGNHELWTVPHDPVRARGEERYLLLVELCRELGAVTPEDEFLTWRGVYGSVTVAPCFVLYDHSFALPFADTARGGPPCAPADARYLHCDPYPSRAAWCRARVEVTRQRLDAVDAIAPLVIVMHFPPRAELAARARVPALVPWSGTRATENWHLAYNVEAIVYGHTHRPSTVWRDGVRFADVSLGMPREWRLTDPQPRQILPLPRVGPLST